MRSARAKPSAGIAGPQVPPPSAAAPFICDLTVPEASEPACADLLPQNLPQQVVPYPEDATPAVEVAAIPVSPVAQAPVPVPRAPVRASAGAPGRRIVAAASVAAALALVLWRPLADPPASPAQGWTDPVRSAAAARSAGAETRLALLPVATIDPPASQAAILLPPAAVAALPPDARLAPVLAPGAAERVSARPTPSRQRIAARVAPSKPVAPAPAVPEAADEPYARFASRTHAPGRYRLRWGVARLGEDSNQDSARGPAWDFAARAAGE
ncbi:hypothetical protein [Methylobacterium trifolii]|nr:hypothetical protein [Methylobacterium trifolii]